jgi:hypothetical protein
VQATRGAAALVGLPSTSLPPGQATLTWDGRLPDGTTAADGRYALSVQAAGIVGAPSVPFILDTVSPGLRLVARKPLLVRVGEPGILRLTADGRSSTIKVNRAGVVRLGTTGRRVTLLAEDAAGNRSPVLRAR